MQNLISTYMSLCSFEEFNSGLLSFLKVQLQSLRLEVN